MRSRLSRLVEAVKNLQHPRPTLPILSSCFPNASRLLSAVHVLCFLRRRRLLAAVPCPSSPSACSSTKKTAVRETLPTAAACAPVPPNTTGSSSSKAPVVRALVACLLHPQHHVRAAPYALAEGSASICAVGLADLRPFFPSSSPSFLLPLRPTSLQPRARARVSSTHLASCVLLSRLLTPATCRTRWTSFSSSPDSVAAFKPSTVPEPSERASRQLRPSCTRRPARPSGFLAVIPSSSPSNTRSRLGIVRRSFCCVCPVRVGSLAILYINPTLSSSVAEGS
jgi:hypothetical protein